MALQWPAAWPALRLAAGVASAFVFIYTSAWCLGQLSRLGLTAMGALIYAGPGGGIVLGGLAATIMVPMGWSAALGWLIFGVLAALLTAAVWTRLRHCAATARLRCRRRPSSLHRTRDQSHGGAEVALLALAYGLAGFGYIITATFLPVIARQSLSGSPWLDMFWPILGAGDDRRRDDRLAHPRSR